MSKICKKRLHGNEKIHLPCAFKKCPGLLHFTLLKLKTFWLTLVHKNNFKYYKKAYFMTTEIDIVGEK